MLFEEDSIIRISITAKEYDRGKVGIAYVIAILLFCVSGCSTTDLKYGALSGMQHALVAADEDCGNDNLRYQAVDWLVKGVNDLKHRQRFLDKGSDDYHQLRGMLRELTYITERRISGEAHLCLKIARARKVTDEFIAIEISLAMQEKGSL